MSPAFQLTEKSLDPDHALIVVRGDVDLFSAPELAVALQEAIDRGATWIVADLAQTTFLDSHGLGALVAATRRIRARHGDLAIVCPPPRVAQTFEVTGLDRVFTLAPSRKAALEAVDRPR